MKVLFFKQNHREAFFDREIKRVQRDQQSATETKDDTIATGISWHFFPWIFMCHASFFFSKVSFIYQTFQVHLGYF